MSYNSVGVERIQSFVRGLPLLAGDESLRRLHAVPGVPSPDESAGPMDAEEPEEGECAISTIASEGIEDQ
jgi:hypothetical protein